MKKPYEKPKIVIELFDGMDIITFSGGSYPGDDEPEEPISDD